MKRRGYSFLSHLAVYRSGRENMGMSTITVTEFANLLKSNQAPYIVDVRTPAEFAECHVTGAKLAPIDSLDPRKIADDLKPAEGSQIYLLCKSGGRATRAAEQFRASGIQNVSVVTGGTTACVEAGVPVTRSGGKAGIPLDGQVRIALGVMILICWFGARWVPGIGYLVPLLAAGFIFSGITGFCGMAIILGKAPWNQNRDAESSRIG
jgi:rhodanese-related sulfurtransferase